MIWEEVLFEELKDCPKYGQLGYQSQTILMFIHVLPWCYLPSFSSILNTSCEETSFEKFLDDHHCGHLVYWNETHLLILILYVAMVSKSYFFPDISYQTKFQLNLTYGLRDIL